MVVAATIWTEDRKACGVASVWCGFVVAWEELPVHARASKQV